MGPPNVPFLNWVQACGIKSSVSTTHIAASIIRAIKDRLSKNSSISYDFRRFDRILSLKEAGQVEK
jgi:hypothetical protein